MVLGKSIECDSMSSLPDLLKDPGPAIALHMYLFHMLDTSVPDMYLLLAEKEASYSESRISD